MVTFSEIFTQLPAFRIAVCHEHRSVVTARSVASHVNLQHRHLAVQARQRIVKEALGIAGRRFVGRRHEQHPIPRRGRAGDRRMDYPCGATARSV